MSEPPTAHEAIPLKSIRVTNINLEQIYRNDLSECMEMLPDILKQEENVIVLIKNYMFNKRVESSYNACYDLLNHPLLIIHHSASLWKKHELSIHIGAQLVSLYVWSTIYTFSKLPVQKIKFSYCQH